MHSCIEISGESIPADIVRYQYDVMGNLKLQENSIGTQDIFSYDNQNRQIQHIRQRKDGTEHISTSVRYDVNGNVRFETDGNNVTTEKTYDGMNRLKAVTITVSGITQTTTYRYDRNGNLTHETDWRNNTWTNVYDPLNRLTEKWDPYNNCIQKLEYNDNHVQVKSYDALNNITQYEYDMNNRLVKTIDPELNETAQEYDALGNIISKTDGRNNTTRFEYDELNRLVKVINANNEETVYTYDLNGNMLTQTDGKGHTITYEYNCVNLVTRRIDHGGRTDSGYDLSKTESYTYYADGNVKTKTDRNGDTTTYTYDCHGRVKTETIGGSTISYTYDCNGNLLAITDDRGETVRTYDELNRVTSKTVPDIGTVEYEYDIITGAGQGETAERIIDPKGNITVRIYDRAGRLKAVIDGDISSTEKTTYEYYPNGSRKSVIYPNGITEEYTYYPDNTLRTLTNKYSDGTVMDVYTYTYDEANNQVSKHEIINGVEKGTTLYEYDALNRLKKVTEPGGKVTSYTYDRAGNRETETITGNGQTIVNTYEYNEQNRLMTVTTETDGTVTEVTVYTYDNNGNQIKTEVTEYINGIVQEPVIAVTHTYDKRNQLIRTETADGSVITNAYNGEGLRVAKTVNGQTTYFLYEYDKVVLEVCADGAEKARNLYGTNLLMRTVGDESYYYVYNGHADVTALIDKTGNIAATYYYDVFGNILEETGNIDNNITYAGYQYDAETGLYYLNARMYDPKIARFLQEDTYRGDPNDPLSLNLYTYCFNNPLIYYDPTGHWPEWLEKLAEKFRTGFEAIVLSSDEERKEALRVVYQYGSDDTYTNVVTSIAAGLGEVVDYYRDPVKQLEETNEILFSNVKNKSFLYKLEAVSVCGVELIKGTIKTGTFIGETIGSAGLTLIYDDIDYRLQFKEKIEAWKSMPQNMLDGIIGNVKTLFDEEKARDFFENPDANLASNVEYMSAAINTVNTVYSGGKLLQSGHQILKAGYQGIKNININSGSMGLSVSGYGGAGVLTQGSSISIAVDVGLVRSGIAAGVKGVAGAAVNYAIASGGSSNEGASETLKTPNSNPEEFTKLKGNQGYKDGNIWKKDQLHKDHWDISNKKGDKIREVDFYGREIWPNGPKNKNKSPK